MSKLMIWVGQFDSKADFEKYMDQSDYRKWWAEYDEVNKEMRCQFCKELGVMSYDEDFLIMKYAPSGLRELLNLIPADTKKIIQTLADNGIENANAAIMYNCREGISAKKAENSTTMIYLGSYDFELSPEGVVGSTTAGLRYMIWIGSTDKGRDEFMEYFNQDAYLQEQQDYEEGRTQKRPNTDHRCQFCKDLGIKFYYPEFLRVRFCDIKIDPVKMIVDVINDSNILESWIEDDCLEYCVPNANCVVCYIPNGFKDKKKDQKIFILKEEYRGLLGVPKQYVEELSDYNGIKYLKTYKWS
ncbi:immunity 22 family protein [Duncaniella muris]|jgi:hypothetical protein|uniref:immunity 22 family protein n=1 Tax=Duncaniella muris TaxID=2094150 RepID=UPI0025B65284|nr:immunity 22 family protein [Duncaniella muris]